LNGCTALGGRDFNLKVAISRKRCEIGPRLQLITNRKSYTGFGWHRKQWPGMTLSTKIEVFTDFTFVRSGPSYMHCCRAFPLRSLGFLVLLRVGRQTVTRAKSVATTRKSEATIVSVLHAIVAEAAAAITSTAEDERYDTDWCSAASQARYV